MKSEKLFPMTPEEFDKIMTNPYYCLPRVHEIFFHQHEPMITEEEFVKAGLIMIEEVGAKRYIELLLENLKGNDPYPGITELDVPDGYMLRKNTGEDGYISEEDNNKMREYIANLSDDPSWKEKVWTLNGQELLQLLKDHGFSREDEDDSKDGKGKLS